MVKTAAFLVTFLLSVSCANSGEVAKSPGGPEATECSTSNLTEVFKNPKKYDDQYFCGRVFVYFEPKYLAFYDRPIAGNDSDLYKVALLPTDISRSKFEAISHEAGKQIYLRGRLDVDKYCLPEGDAEKRDSASCAPVSHPIYIANPKFRPIN